MSKNILGTPADIGALIKDRRHALGLDQAILAERVGVSRWWINQVERGKPGANPGLILRTFLALDIELTADVRRQESGPAVPSDIDAIIEAARAPRGA